jgi:hypothetical protein
VKQILAKRAQAREGFTIFLSVRRGFARYNVIYVAYGKPLDVDSSAPGILEAFYTVRGEDKVQIEWAIFELNEILALADLCRLLICQCKSKFP